MICIYNYIYILCALQSRHTTNEFIVELSSSSKFWIGVSAMQGKCTAAIWQTYDKRKHLGWEEISTSQIEGCFLPQVFSYNLSILSRYSHDGPCLVAKTLAAALSLECPRGDLPDMGPHSNPYHTEFKCPCTQCCTHLSQVLVAATILLASIDGLQWEQVQQAARRNVGWDGFVLFLLPCHCPKHPKRNPPPPGGGGGGAFFEFFI